MAVPLASLASPTVYVPLGSANEIMIVDAATDKVIGEISGVSNPHGLSITPNGEYLVAGSNTEEMAGHAKAPGTSGKSKMPKPAGEAQHKQHHPRQAGGAMMPDRSTMAGQSMTMGGSSQTAGKSEAPGNPCAGKPDQSKMPKPRGVSGAEHKKHRATRAGGLPPAVGISRVSLIRVADNKLEHRIKVRGMAHHILVTPDGRYAVSTQTTAGTISLIDLATKKIFRTIHTGPLPNYIVVTRDGKRMYVSNAGNNTISVIDTKNWIVSRNIIVGKGPEHTVLSPDENFLYTGNARNGTISVVSLHQNKVVRIYAIGKEPHGIDISSDGKTLFASAKKDNKLVAVDVKTGKMRTLKLKPAPYHVKVIGGTGKIYVSSRKKPLIWVVDEKKLKVTGKIPVRGAGHQMVVVN